MGMEKLKRSNTPIDLEFTYTVPQNWAGRFTSNSKVKAAYYCFEYFFWAKEWSKYYHIPTHFCTASNFSAEIFVNNGIPADKIYVIPHGVDVEKFNPGISPEPLKTQKKFKFVAVAAPHYRKKIDRLINAYSQAFTAADDVCLVLKTKLYRQNDPERQGYAPRVSEYLEAAQKKYGAKMPEIEIVDRRLDNVGALYAACHVNVSTTGAEAFGMTMLEAMSVGLPSIAPGYGGQLHYMNNQNSLLIDTGVLEVAPAHDQYWGFDKRNRTFACDLNQTSELMIRSYREYDAIRAKLKPGMEKTVQEYSWLNAARKMTDMCEGKAQPYRPGTVKL
jgi:glycosyltransferase involved in cell wall biosynthesis